MYQVKIGVYTCNSNAEISGNNPRMHLFFFLTTKIKNFNKDTIAMWLRKTKKSGTPRRSTNLYMVNISCRLLTDSVIPLIFEGGYTPPHGEYFVPKATL